MSNSINLNTLSNSHYFSKLRIIFLTLITMLFLNACGNWSQEIIKNRENITKLRKGMTKSQVKAIMGEPLVNEVYNKPNVWFYYTDCKWSDGAITREECTPLVFKDGKLEGIGWKYYNTHYLLIK